MPTNFELERLKPKVDIFKIPENRVHELTDSNVSQIGKHVLWDSSNVRTQGFCFGLLRRADMRELRRARTFWRKSARRNNPEHSEQNPLVQTLELSQRTCLPTCNFELKQLKPKLDIVKKPEN